MLVHLRQVATVIIRLSEGSIAGHSTQGTGSGLFCVKLLFEAFEVHEMEASREHHLFGCL